jgi:carbon storage regulator
MLVLTRKIDEEIKIGLDVSIRILSISENQIKLGIDAPKSVQIYRGEVYDKVKATTIEASRVNVQIQSNLQKYKIKKIE